MSYTADQVTSAGYKCTGGLPPGGKGTASFSRIKSEYNTYNNKYTIRLPPGVKVTASFSRIKSKYNI